MFGCEEVLWSATNAQRARDLIEEATGRPCLCGGGQRCPFLDGRRLALSAEFQRHVNDVGQHMQVGGPEMGVEVDRCRDRLMP